MEILILQWCLCVRFYHGNWIELHTINIVDLNPSGLDNHASLSPTRSESATAASLARRKLPNVPRRQDLVAGPGIRYSASQAKP